MKAGVDFGTSLVKAVWMNNGEYKFSSTADASLEEVARQLSENGVKIIHIAGIGYSSAQADYFKDFELKMANEDPIKTEIRLQAEGTKRLLENNGYQTNNFLLVSIGTGTSYTIVTDKGATKFPFGNSLGGGFINGLGKVLGAKNYDELAAKSTEGVSLDLCIKDIIPEKAGSFEGELVVANFGRGISDAEKASAYASAISTVAVATIRDVMLLEIIPNFQAFNNIVYIGSTVSRTPLLKELLQTYSVMIGKNPYFLEHGEFALAMGAYHTQR